MPIQVKFDFFRVMMPSDTSVTFAEIIEKVSDSKNDESRNVDVRGFPIRLQESSSSKNVHEGDLLRIQMSSLPSKAKLSGKINDLELDNDEGLGNESAFLYDSRTQVVVLQRNRMGPSASALALYFQDKSGVQPIILQPVLQRNAMSRLAKLKEVQKIEINFAGITNPAFYKNARLGVTEFLDLMERFQAPCASMTLSMGRDDGSLFLKEISKLARSVVKWPAGTEQVTKMEISGVTDDDEKDVFDLLRYRMIEVGTVEESRHRRVSYKKRGAELRRAWERRRADLDAMFV